MIIINYLLVNHILGMFKLLHLIYYITTSISSMYLICIFVYIINNFKNFKNIGW